MRRLCEQDCIAWTEQRAGLEARLRTREIHLIDQILGDQILGDPAP